MSRYLSLSTFFDERLGFLFLLKNDPLLASGISSSWYSSRKSVVYGSINFGSILLNADAVEIC